MFAISTDAFSPQVWTDQVWLGFFAFLTVFVVQVASHLNLRLGQQKLQTQVNEGAKTTVAATEKVENTTIAIAQQAGITKDDVKQIAEIRKAETGIMPKV